MVMKQAAGAPPDEQRCAEAVDALLERRGWRLLDRAAWIRQTLEALRAGVAGEPVQAAINRYSLALYRACAGEMGDDRREIAYAELFRYLYDSAASRYADVCEDATQRALVNICARIGRCREPGAFLAFAAQQLMDAARAIRRQEASRAWPLDAIDERAVASQGPPARSFGDPEGKLLADEQRTRFEQLAARFLAKHPRAGQQFAALRLKFIDGLDEPTISRRLGKPVRSVHILRSRALKKLRKEPEWRAFANELGLLSEE